MMPPDSTARRGFISEIFSFDAFISNCFYHVQAASSFPFVGSAERERDGVTSSFSFIVVSFRVPISLNWKKSSHFAFILSSLTNNQKYT